jgi:hypothetical protein
MRIAITSYKSLEATFKLPPRREKHINHVVPMQSFLLLNISAARRCIGFGSRALSIAAARNEATLQELYMRAVEPKVPEA